MLWAICAFELNEPAPGKFIWRFWGTFRLELIFDGSDIIISQNSEESRLNLRET